MEIHKNTHHILAEKGVIITPKKYAQDKKLVGLCSELTEEDLKAVSGGMTDTHKKILNFSLVILGLVAVGCTACGISYGVSCYKDKKQKANSEVLQNTENNSSKKLNIVRPSQKKGQFHISGSRIVRT